MTVDDAVKLIDAFKWPAVVLVMFVIVLFIFSHEIRGFFGRARKLSFAGASVTSDEDAKAAQAVIAPPAGGAVVPANPHPFELADSLYVRSVSDQIARNVGTMAFPSIPDRDRWLFREGARLAIGLEFERVYRNVWASQMDLLGAANVRAIPIEEARTRYETAARDAPSVYKDYSFESWLGFMVENGLLRRDGEHVLATDKGSTFIQYLVGQRYDLFGIRRGL